MNNNKIAYLPKRYFKIYFGENGDYTLIATDSNFKPMNPKERKVSVYTHGLIREYLGDVVNIVQIDSNEFNQKTTMLDDFYYSEKRLDFVPASTHSSQ